MFQTLVLAGLVAVTAIHSVAQDSLPAKASAGPAASATVHPQAETTRQLAVANTPWMGDFDKMLDRRMIRIYTPYSRSLYFVDKGRERGLGAELVRDFERWVNQKYAKELGKRPLTVYIVAATRDKLLSDLNDGLADIAVGNLTVTEERKKFVDFVAPDDKLVNVEILVTGPASPAIASLDDLSGKTVHVRKTSSSLRQPDRHSRRRSSARPKPRSPCCELSRATPR